ncbi:protein ESSENTIAL FOR POTEXVIRUS ACCUMULATION 1-like [Mercurialis annua]|uniref:protein ESSENTIAL FOR POTEXVIRUS ACCUMULATION 1-like n=1 Tax=Mercurialis annua TaxID=3986 RepID=UPI002160C328|nr:protein ESSENTIAL FOR POTEXVIRUS ACCUMULATION 1-like [Mercurialis annua]
MADRKLDLPDDLLISKPSDHSSWNPKVDATGNDVEKLHVGLHDDTKDQLASESSIPLSPQWLYSKPNETKDTRALSAMSLGNTNDVSQKEGWRLEGTDDKKDWRRIATENESSRRWREEERETGLLGARRDRRKTERRVENVSVRETMENRVMPSSDRWHDGSARNSGHEARRDSKWSSRWGPDDKEKEPRTEKKTETEKEKEDAHSDNQSSTISNRSVSERDSESRDKWRPRHRLEVHSAGSTSYRAAPGFGGERGRGDGSNPGFAVGRGRSNAIGRGLSVGSATSAQSHKSGGVIGKPNLTVETFCYPRGKLLDIYRRQKFDSSFGALPKEMEESFPLTQDGGVEPFAFVAPDSEEEAVLTDIWKGKITSSEVAYNSFRKARSTENVSGVGEGKSGTLPSFSSEETADLVQDAASNGAYQIDVDPSLWNHASHSNVLDERDSGHEEENKVTGDAFTAPALGSDGGWNMKEISTSSPADSQFAIGENGQMMNSAMTRHFLSDGNESVSFFNSKSKLPDDSNSLFVLPSADQDHHGTMSLLENRSETKDLDRDTLPEDLYFYYTDPHGMTQGPFLGADILLWFEEGYFGLDLPVRLADAPEGSPFHSLGEVMPSLKLRAVYLSSELEQSGALVGELEPDLPSGSILENTDPSALTELGQPLSDLTDLSVQHAQSRMSESENPLQLPHSEGQNFHDFVAQDEEIVFPGRPGSSGYSTTQSSRSSRDLLANSNGLPSLPNELADPGLPYQSENKLHPFGLFWSELEGSQARQSELSDLSSSLGRSAPFGALSDPASVSEKWADVYRQDMLSVPNSYQDATAAHHMPLVEQEPNHFDLAEQLISRKFQQQQQQQQQQLQQRNMLSSHSHLNESLLEHVPGQNLMHHPLANHSMPDLEHLLVLQQLQQQQQQQQQLQQQQLQQQQQRQLQLQQHQLQQQQFQQQQQKLLQERQQSQARQVLIEQLLHGQISDSGLQQSRVDQVLLEQQLLHELQQQRSHHSQRHYVPSVEQQYGQGKFGQTPQQDPQREMLELLSRAQHGQMQSLEHQILQEQLQARQLSMGVRQRMNMEEERHIDSMWNINENDHFLRGLAGNPRSHASGVGQLDLYQRQQRALHEDQLSHMERNLSFQDRLRQGVYEPGSMNFERSLSLPAGASGMNMDIVNAMAHGLDIHELSTRMQSAGQVGTLSSGSHPHNHHHPLVQNQFHVPHMDAIDSRWPESSGPLANDWMESRMQQMHIDAERQKRDSDTKLTTVDSSFWMSDGSNDDKSRRLLMELLHQKSSHQSADSLQLNDGLSSSDNRLPSGLYSGSSSLDHHFSVAPDQEAIMNNSFGIGSYVSNTREPAKVAGEQASHLGNTEKLLFRSESGATREGHSSLYGISETPQAALKDSNFMDNFSANRGYLEVEGRKYASKSQGMPRVPVTEIQNGIAEQTDLATTGRGEVQVNVLSRHSSLSVPGFYDDKSGQQNSFAEDISINQVPVLSKGQENILLRRPPVPRPSASQEGLAESVSDTIMRGRVSSGIEGPNAANQGADMASSKKDVRFRRTSSCGDADVSEPSFIDMLKSNAKKIPAPEGHMTTEASDGGQGGRGGKKKGKKGRQIDPALLGFKVTSNRIMMGEIQRIED